jgi:hypothetical protein
MLSAAALSTAGLLAGCSVPAADAATAPSALPSNIDCSGPSVGGSELGVDVGGKRTIKGQKGASESASGIVAHGSCTIVGTPDTAMLTVLVRVQAPTERAAVDGANAKAGAATTILTSKGVAQGDIGGDSLRVVPVASQLLRSATGIGGVQITGYAAIRTITATLHDLTAAGPIVSLVTDQTGDSGKVQVAYYLADDRGLRDQARAAAIQRAQANARELAADSGVALGSLASLAEMQDAPDPKQAGAYQETVDMVYGVDG